MSEKVIKVENLSKRYRLGQYVGGAYQYRTLRDVLTDAMYAPFRRLHSIFSGSRSSTPHSLNQTNQTNEINQTNQMIWALKDVSFEVKQGEVVGIIGRNGAGKTTLLKVLSRITEPTKGRAEIKGRIGSLLEVGTGFHPELTGRENIYLSGAILGMTKKEIDRKFDEIVAFAELERFIDTPAKRYSSGMWVRLGFAVAAHLEPEILLVDEVLAVGDYRFQQKCLGKMQEVGQAGRTILFVSHNMLAVRRLCENTILLDSGRIEYKGATDECIGLYLKNASTVGTTELDTTLLKRPETLGKSFRFSRVKLLSGSGSEICLGKPFGVELEFQSLETTRDVALGIGINTLDGIRVLDCRSTDAYPPIKLLPRGNYAVRVTLENNPLIAGDYTISVGAGCDADGIALDVIENVIRFRALPLDTRGTPRFELKQGFFRIHAQWTKPLHCKGGPCS